MPLSLRPVTAENWDAVARLEIQEDQRHFVAPNRYSLAQAAYEPGYTPVAIYADETLVGFAMYTHEPWQGEYGIVRMMIDQHHQGKGYGRQAVIALDAVLRQMPGCTSIILNVVKANTRAWHLYHSLGFVIFREAEDVNWARLA
ncbi:MAG TPA: GNAT family N-acetyltransferase [Ktedonobacterales bacterium]